MVKELLFHRSGEWLVLHFRFLPRLSIMREAHMAVKGIRQRRATSELTAIGGGPNMAARG